MLQSTDRHSRAALSAKASSTGWMSVGELEITRRIALVAVCCSSASVNARFFSCRISPVAFSRSKLSVRRFSRSLTLEPSFFSDLRTSGCLALTLGVLGFAPRGIRPSLLLTGPYDRGINDRLGEDAPMGKWAGRVLDDACECSGAWGGLI